WSRSLPWSSPARAWRRSRRPDWSRFIRSLRCREFRCSACSRRCKASPRRWLRFLRCSLVSHGTGEQRGASSRPRHWRRGCGCFIAEPSGLESGMAGSVNKVILIGNLGRDPESRTFSNGGKVVKFSLATSETWTRDGDRQERTEWHNVVIYDEKIGDV